MNDSLRRIVEILGPESITTLVESTNRVTAASASLGITVTTEEVLEVEAVKLACMTDIDLDISAALDQLRSVPSVAAKIKAKHEAELVADGHAQHLDGMSRQDRMTYARENNLTGKSVSASKLSKAEHLTILAGLGPNQRMSYARKHGIDS